MKIFSELPKGVTADVFLQPRRDVAGVTLDAASGAFSTTGTSLTFSHTCAAGASLAVVLITTRETGATGVTYNGVALTKQHGFTIPLNDTIEIWTLADPASGAHDVVISVAESMMIVAGGISVLGADPTDVSLASAHAGGFLGVVSVDVTSAADDLVISIVLCEPDRAHVAGAGETQHWSDNGGGSAIRASCTSKPGSGATTTMVTDPDGSTTDSGIVAMSFRRA